MGSRSRKPSAAKSLEASVDLVVRLQRQLRTTLAELEQYKAETMELRKTGADLLQLVMAVVHANGDSLEVPEEMVEDIVKYEYGLTLAVDPDTRARVFQTQSEKAILKPRSKIILPKGTKK